MNKYFYKFIKINKKILDGNVDYNKYIMVVDRARYLPALSASIILSAYCKKFNFKPVLLTDKVNLHTVSIFKSFGINLAVLGFRYKLIFIKPFILFRTLKIFFNSLYNLKKNNFIWFINNFKVNNVLIGDLIYDTYIQDKLKYKNPKIDLRFINVLFKSIFRTLNLIDIINFYKIKSIFSNTEGYASNDSIALRIGISKKIKSYLFLSEPPHYDLHNYNRKNIKYGTCAIKNLGFTIKKLKNLDVSKKQLSNFIEKRFLGRLTTGYTPRQELLKSNEQKKYLTKQQLLKKLKIFKKIKKIILIAPSAFADAPHVLGTQLIFRDYYDQLESTLKFLSFKNLKEILWLVRPHPGYDDENIVEDLVFKLKNRELIHCCTKKIISTLNLVDICDNVVGGRGTIGLEFACGGKYPIIAGSATYSGLGIAIQPKTQKEYFKNLLEINKIKKMSSSQVLFAQKALYYLEHLFPSNLKIPETRISYNIRNSKILDKKVLQNHQKNQSLLFSHRLINNIKKLNFENDNLYQDYSKYLQI